MNYKTLKSTTLVQGRVFDLRRDEVRFPSGNTHTLDIVDHGGAVCIAALDPDGKLLLVRQYRHATAGMLLEFPAGTLEEGEEPEACAQRELREEAGYGARQMEKLGEFFLSPGYSTQVMHLYFAQDLFAEQLEGDEDEELEIERLALPEARTAVADGEIRDAKTIIAVLMLEKRIEAD